ncbi:MAG: aspartate aminotransferase family protein [Desulfobacteraceae bacterium]|nr:MAG: aspartate aminotransferase family protein [Desulfobacteraceae bacterium]
MTTSEIQDKMFAEFLDFSLYEKALKEGYQYLTHAMDRHVFPDDDAMAALKQFDEPFPESCSSGTGVLDILKTYGEPATVPHVGGRYFGFVIGSMVPASLSAKILSAFWDQCPAMEVLSPLGAALESVVEAWLKEIFSLPEQCVAGYVSGTSSAIFCSLAAARYRVLQRCGWDVNEKGLYEAPKIRIVAGRQVHSTVIKGISLMGFGKENIEWVDVDSQGRIIPEAIPRLDKKTILLLQAGNVNSGAFDNFSAICESARNQGAWIHIDGAFGLWVQACGSLRHLTRGCWQADSWSVDCHKTLNTPYDSGVVICRDREALIDALHMSGAYIVKGKGRDGMFYTPEMSRRARIFEIWSALKYLGRKGLDQMVAGFHDRAVQFEEELAAAGFEVVNEVVFNQVLVRCETDELTLKTLEQIQKLRVCWCGGSKWEDREVIRLSICSWSTTRADVSLAVRSFVDARALAAGSLSG